ncbi:protein serine/threonine phosphatase 2C [Marasmius fiardii PR-910]|nr:protein serine/threonine phosphatase 2C [Marasmius fiardii PR-910]
MPPPGNAANCKYTRLSEPQLAAEIARIALTQRRRTLHVASFQPNQAPSNGIGNQDISVTEDWVIEGETWRLRAVFDGHANGNETVDFASQTLPSMIQKRLNELVTTNKSFSTDSVKTLLTAAITELDNSITEELFSLFPSEEYINKLGDEEIQKVINDMDTGGINFVKVARCMRGTTAVVALVGPNTDIWVATLGDSQGVLGIKSHEGDWSTKVLSSNHSAKESSEIERIKKEHPGEDLVVTDDRVLGVIAVTRAIGDHLFKLPSVYASRIFRNAFKGLRPGSEEMIKKLMQRNLTPPYLSNVPDVEHLNLKEEGASHGCLILCSDGLMDLYAVGIAAMAEIWIRMIAERSLIPQISNSEQIGSELDVQVNLALRLIYEGLGECRRDEDKMSWMLTLEMDDKWMDDTTVIVEGILV